MYYLNIFFVYSFLGFIFETVLCSVISPEFRSGVLYGPWTFIYGIAVFFIMGVNKFLKRFHLKKILEIILFYIIITVLITLIEFSGGMLIEKIFGEVYWNYIPMKYNYGFYICLEVSLIWGLFATLVNYVIMPRLNKVIKKIPKFVTIILIILFVVDCIFSFTK